jgi:hydrogenase maturation protease
MRHIIGFGNPLHGDDGFAAAVCAALQATDLPDDVRVFDAGTRGLDALALLESCDEAILLDAAMPAGQPGAIHRPDPDAVLQEGGWSWHASGVGALLRAQACLSQGDGSAPRLRLLTVEAAHQVQFSPGLSPPVAAAVGPVTEELRRYLEGSA